VRTGGSRRHENKTNSTYKWFIKGTTDNVTRRKRIKNSIFSCIHAKINWPRPPGTSVALGLTHLAERNCNEYGTIYAISSDFGDRMTTQSMRLMVLLSEHI